MKDTLWKKIETPLKADEIKEFRAGDMVLISGVVYTARDKAHERLCRLAEENSELPFDPENQIIYYVGPSPAPPGEIIGSAGPTTSYRMDPFTETILKMGVRGMIGKGKRDEATRKLIAEYGAVYFSSFGGAAAYLNRCIVEAEVVAFQDLGPEAVYRLVVRDFPAVVINDSVGGDLYEHTFQKRK